MSDTIVEQGKTEDSTQRDGLDNSGVPELCTLSEQMRYAKMWFREGIVSRKSFANEMQVLVAIQTLKGLGVNVVTTIRQCAFDRGVFIVFGDVPLAIVHRSGHVEQFEEKAYCWQPVWQAEDYSWAEFIMQATNDELMRLSLDDTEWVRASRMRAIKIRSTPHDKKHLVAQSVDNNNTHLPTAVVSCTIRRRGLQNPIVSFFSLERAQRAQLSNKTGPWQTYPHIMMMRRARGVALQQAFSDVLQCVGTDLDLEGAPEHVLDRRVREHLTQQANQQLAPAPAPVMPAEERERAIDAVIRKAASAPQQMPKDEAEEALFAEERAKEFEQDKMHMRARDELS